MCAISSPPSKPPDRTQNDESIHVRLKRLREDSRAVAAITRDVARILVIVVYLMLALWLLAVHGEPEGFLVILPWALWSRSE
jgi:hypothetical protein